MAVDMIKGVVLRSTLSREFLGEIVPERVGRSGLRGRAQTSNQLLRAGIAVDADKTDVAVGLWIEVRIGGR